MGFSRDTFYRVSKAYQEGGIEALPREEPAAYNRLHVIR